MCLNWITQTYDTMEITQRRCNGGLDQSSNNSTGSEKRWGPGCWEIKFHLTFQNLLKKMPQLFPITPPNLQCQKKLFLASVLRLLLSGFNILLETPCLCSTHESVALRLGSYTMVIERMISPLPHCNKFRS